MSVTAKRELESPASESASKKRKTGRLDRPVEASSDDTTQEGVTREGGNQADAAIDRDPSTYTNRKTNLLRSNLPGSGEAGGNDDDDTAAAYHRKELTLDLYLPPIDSRDPLAGVERQLDDVLLTYVKEAEGILMGWDSPRFLQPSARVLEESPFSLVSVAVSAIVWRPQRGEELRGQIKLMGPSHIGLLILGTFNASIPATLIPRDWTFEETSWDAAAAAAAASDQDGFWKDGNGTPLAIDQTLLFKTVDIKKGANILSVEGSLLEQVFQPKYEGGRRTLPLTTAPKHQEDANHQQQQPQRRQTNEDEGLPAREESDPASSEERERLERQQRRREKKALKAKRKSEG